MLHWVCHSQDGRTDQPQVTRLGTIVLIGVLVLSAIGHAPGRSANDDASQVDTVGNQALSGDCVLLQRLIYQPCHHELLRRVSLPGELTSKTRAELEEYYADWQITTYAPNEVGMEQTLDLFCPQHIVLQSDESGMLCIWQNSYGDAMSLVRSLTTPLNDLPDDAQELVRFGIGFDTMDALNQWLESIES